MCIDAHITRCPTQALSFSVRNVLLCLWISVLLGHPKIYDVNEVCILRSWSANKEVVWFDIAVDEVLLVDGLHSRNLTSIDKRFAAWFGTW